MSRMQSRSSGTRGDVGVLIARLVALFLLLGLPLGLCAAASARPAKPAKPRTVAFVGASLIDGTGRELQPNSVILVRGDSIAAVGPINVLQVPSDAQLVRVDGRFIVPGLINSHVHLATLANPREAHAYLRRELYSGVTAVRDMAGDIRLLGELKREAAFDEIVAPDVYYAALMAGPAFFVDPRTHDAARGFEPGTAPWMRAVSADTDLPLAIAEARGTGATAIKIYDYLEGPMVAAITAEAHKQHMLVWAHATVFPASPLEVANAGVDVMSHAGYLAYQLDMPKSVEAWKATTPLTPRAGRTDPAMEALLEVMKARGIILDATVDWAYLHPSEIGPAAVWAFITREAYRLGVMISAGTDDDADWKDRDSVLCREIGRLVNDVGMKPIDAIRSATYIGARTIGAQELMGTIEPGKLANFVILSRNPLVDIGNVCSVVTVVKHGVQHSRGAYRPVTVEEMKAPPN